MALSSDDDVAAPSAVAHLGAAAAVATRAGRNRSALHENRDRQRPLRKRAVTAGDLTPLLDILDPPVGADPAGHAPADREPMTAAASSEEACAFAGRAERCALAANTLREVFCGNAGNRGVGLDVRATQRIVAFLRRDDAGDIAAANACTALRNLFNLAIHRDIAAAEGAVPVLAAVIRARQPPTSHGTTATVAAEAALAASAAAAASKEADAMRAAGGPAARVRFAGAGALLCLTDGDEALRAAAFSDALGIAAELRAVRDTQNVKLAGKRELMPPPAAT